MAKRSLAMHSFQQKDACLVTVRLCLIPKLKRRICLNVSDEKIRSKGIKSIRSRVANINDFLDHPLSMEDFKQKKSYYTSLMVMRTLNDIH